MTDTSLTTDPTSARRRVAVRIVVVALLAAHAALSWAGRPDGIGTSHDEARYVLLAQALSHGSYAEPWSASHVIHSLYPPGYPALLAAWRTAFGHSYEAMVALSVLASTLALLLAYRAAETLSAGVALGALAALSFNPYLISSAGTLYSEPAYMLWSLPVLALLGCGRQDRRLAGAAAFALLAGLTRSVGLALVLAVGVHLLLERRFRALALFAAASVLTVGLWSLWTVVAFGQHADNSYVADAVARVHSLQTSGGRVVLERIGASVWRLFAIRLPYRLPIPTIPGTWLDNAFGAIATMAGLAVGAVLAWKRWRIAVLYLAAYIGLLLMWPWQVPRFLVPLLPVVVPLTLAGWEWLGGRAGRRMSIAAVAVAAAVLAANGGWRVSGYVRQRLACRHEPAPPGVRSCSSQRQVDYFAAARYAKEHLPEEAVVLAHRAGVFYFYSGHRSPSLRGALAQDSLGFLDYLRSKGAGFVLLTGLTSIERGNLAPLVRSNCRWLRVQARFPPTAVLLRVPPVGERDSTNACAAVADYLQANAGPIFDGLGP